MTGIQENVKKMWGSGQKRGFKAGAWITAFAVRWLLGGEAVNRNGFRIVLFVVFLRAESIINVA